MAQNERDYMLYSKTLTWRDPLGGDSPVVYVVFSRVLSSGLNVSAAVRPRSLAGLFLTPPRPWVHVFDRCVSTGFCIVGLQKLTAGSKDPVPLPRTYTYSLPRPHKHSFAFQSPWVSLYSHCFGEMLFVSGDGMDMTTTKAFRGCTDSYMESLSNYSSLL